MKSFLTVLCALSLMTANAQHSLVKDINPGSVNSHPVSFTVYNNKLFFLASTDSFGTELWKHDGTNTSMVADLNPDQASKTFAYHRQTCVLGNSLYFMGNDGVHGEEVWKYDGLNPPTMAANVNTADPMGSFPKFLTAMGGKLYFSGYDNTSGQEMRCFDPVTNTTTLVKDIASGAFDATVTESMVFNGKLYFGADETPNMQQNFELWEHNPATNTTTKVGVSIGLYPSFTVLGNKLYFVGTSWNYGDELYSYDGVNAPVRITDIVAGSGHGVGSLAVNNMAVYKNKLYFCASTTVANIMCYDPATSSLAPAFTAPQFNSTYAAFPCVYANKLYYQGSEQGGNKGMELYRWDGVNQPQLAADIDPGSSSGNAVYINVYDKHIYFSSTTFALGQELYKFYDSDVNSVSTVKFTAVVNIFPNPSADVFSMDMNLERPATFAVQVYDISGKKVYDGGMHSYEVGKHYLSVPAEPFVSGNYTLYLATASGENFYTTKLVKQ